MRHCTLAMAASVLLLVACDMDSAIDAPDASAQPSSSMETPVPAPPEADASAAAPSPSQARLDGFGPLRLDMTTAQAVAAWPGLYRNRPERVASSACDYAQVPGAGLSHFTLMFDDGRFVAYGGSNDTLVAPGGGRRGMSEVALQALYHDALQPARDPDAKGGKRLSMDASGVAPSRLVFVLRPVGKVDEWRVGLRPQVDYEQGCESDRA